MPDSHSVQIADLLPSKRRRVDDHENPGEDVQGDGRDLLALCWGDPHILDRCDWKDDGE